MVEACREAAAACRGGAACQEERTLAASGDSLEVEPHTAQEEAASLHSQKGTIICKIHISEVPEMLPNSVSGLLRANSCAGSHVGNSSDAAEVSTCTPPWTCCRREVQDVIWLYLTCMPKNNAAFAHTSSRLCYGLTADVMCSTKAQLSLQE